MRAAFVYANSRRQLLQEVAEGRAPDTGLLGLNHLSPLGIEAEPVEPRLRGNNRFVWHLRELVLPFDLRRFDAVCTPLAYYLPALLRATRGPRAVVLNMGLVSILRRASRARRGVVLASLRAAAAIVCFAESQRAGLLDEGLAPELVRTLALGVDERFFAPSPPRPGGYVLAVGRDLARDYATFGRAVDGLGQEAVVVASARNLEGVELPAGVDVRLDVSFSELRDLYRGAACVVVPTFDESYPYGADGSGQTVLLDAMASARPVVATRRSALTDYLVDGVTGVFVPPGDAPALRAGIERVLGDEGLAASMGGAARHAVEERFTSRHFAERLAPILKAAAA